LLVAVTSDLADTTNEQKYTFENNKRFISDC